MKMFDRGALMKMGLDKKFAIPTVVLVVVGLGASMLVSYGSSRTAIEEACTGQITQIAGSTAQLIVNWMDDRKLNLVSWSEQEVFKTAVQEGFIAKAARKSADAQFAKFQADYPYLEQIALADAEGRIVAASDVRLKERNVADRVYFQNPVEGEVVIGDVEKSALSENPVFFMSVAVGEKEEAGGILFCAVDMAYFDKTFIDPVEVGQSGYAYIYQEDGFLIAHPDKSNVLKLNMKEFDFGREMI
ncbi:MAG: cache domain-containing protein, partial [Thermodesulfobacteriota bacterium]|nr:cache domain-containing protein [Thermodesulfobacteriota bacterium]